MCNLWISKEHIKYEGVSNLGPPSALFDYTLQKWGTFFACIESVGVDDNGTLHIGRQAMRDCLYATSGFSGITGTLTCDANGDCADPKIAVQQITPGTTDYVKIWP